MRSCILPDRMPMRNKTFFHLVNCQEGEAHNIFRLSRVLKMD
jgi:hypothetical protein